MAAQGWSRTQVNLRQLCGPAREQGYVRNTSAAFAATGLVECLIRAEKSESPVLSAEWAFTQGRGLILAPGSPLRSLFRGVDELPVFAALMALETGLLIEKDWPYNSAQEPRGRITYAPPAQLPFLRQRIALEPIALKDAGSHLLLENRPVAVSLWWYPDHVTEQGEVVPPTELQRAACAETRKDCMTHSVLLVGYDRTTRVFVFRNSKGPHWGDGGYGLMHEESVIRDCVGCYGDWSKAHPDSLQPLKLGFSARLIELNAPSGKVGPLPQP